MRSDSARLAALHADDLPEVLHVQTFAGSPCQGVLFHVLVCEVSAKLAPDSISLWSFLEYDPSRIARD
jgi:hypothetical protein